MTLIPRGYEIAETRTWGGRRRWRAQLGATWIGPWRKSEASAAADARKHAGGSA